MPRKNSPQRKDARRQGALERLKKQLSSNPENVNYVKSQIQILEQKLKASSGVVVIE